MGDEKGRRPRWSGDGRGCTDRADPRQGRVEIARGRSSRLGAVSPDRAHRGRGPLKIIHRRHAEEAQAARRFLREAKLASRLSNPHTVSVIDFGQTHDGLLYLAMELLRGRTLAEVLKSEGPFSPERLVRVGSQLCDALEAAHRLHIVHRDLTSAAPAELAYSSRFTLSPYASIHRYTWRRSRA